MRRRGARESRKKKNQIKAGGMGRKVTCLPLPFPSVLINVFSYYYSFFCKKKKKKKNSFSISLYCPQQSDRHIWVCIWHQSDHSIEVCLR